MAVTMSCGEALLRLLEAYDVDAVFGLPGYHSVELYRGFEETGIRQITPRHEQGSAYGAYGYAATTGKPGVCLLVSGPGLTNALTAIAEAYSNSFPMLVITTMNQTQELGMAGGRMHELRAQGDIIREVTAFTHTLLDARNLPQVLGRAFAVFSSQRPRPVCIQIPTDVLEGPAEFATEPWPQASVPAPEGATVRKIAALLCGAHSPMVVLGGGAARASAEAVRLVERLDAPVVSSCAGKGIVPEDHPLCLGFAQPFGPVQEMIGEADVVLAVGTEFAEPDRYFTDEYKIGGKLIRVDIDPEQLMAYSRPEIALLGDARLALAAILEAMEEIGAPRVAAPGAERVTAMKEHFDGDLCEDAPKHKRVLEVIREVLPEDTLISADPAQMTYTALYHYPVRRAGCFQYPNGYAAMGFGLPFAIGAKLGAPDRPVVCFTGDGCFQMTVEEMAVAVEWKLTLPIIVWANGGYKVVREYMRSKGLPNVGTDIRNPDFAALSQAFGGDGVRVQSLDHLRQALAAALNAGGPTVLEIDGDAPWLM